MNAILTHATIACNKNYMDSKIGVDVFELSTKCNTLGEKKISSIIHEALSDWENVSKEKGKKAACAMTATMVKNIEAAVKPQ